MTHKLHDDLPGFKTLYEASRHDGQRYTVLGQATPRAPQGVVNVHGRDYDPYVALELATAIVGAARAVLEDREHPQDGWQEYAEPDTRKVCIGCGQPQGERHRKTCPVVTGTLRNLLSDEEPATAAAGPADDYSYKITSTGYGQTAVDVIDGPGVHLVLDHGDNIPVSDIADALSAAFEAGKDLGYTGGLERAQHPLCCERYGEGHDPKFATSGCKGARQDG